MARSILNRSQFQSFQSFNRFAPFITGISPFQPFQKPALSSIEGFHRFAPFKTFLANQIRKSFRGFYSGFGFRVFGCRLPA
jgi:hypothetical protein